jgi:hypothetical protein
MSSCAMCVSESILSFPQRSQVTRKNYDGKARNGSSRYSTMLGGGWSP